MNILLTGANGFIGKYLLAALQDAGHRVVPAIRNPRKTDALSPEPASIRIDFNTDTHPDDWLPRLAGIDAVINCAGILQARGRQSITAIHVDAPIALAIACERMGIRRFIQISAISAGEKAGSAYAATKQKTDEFVASTNLNWVILRPSLVYAQGAYGGTALFRAMAALPFRQPLPGNGDQVFQPIHVDDLCRTVLRILENPAINQIVIDPVGPEVLSLRQILTDLRSWLGFSPARFITVPMAVVRLASRLGDFLGGPLNTTALRQLQFGNTGDYGSFATVSGVTPQNWKDALRRSPAQVQDRWHARLYFVRPLLRLALAAMWLASGVLGLLVPTDTADAVGAFFALSPTALQIAIWGSSLTDILMGCLVLLRYRPGPLACAQLLLVAGYTALLGIAQIGLWSDPLGPLLKNLPIAVAILALAAIERDR